MKKFKKLFAAGLVSLCGVFIFSCQNDLDTGLVPEETDAVSVSERATPSSAIEITPVDGVLQIEAGKIYVIRGEVSITGITSTTTASRAARLYIEGTLYLDDPGTAMVFPDGLLTTINDGGKMVGYARKVELGSNCSFLIEKEGRLEAGATYFEYVYGSTESIFINYGYSEANRFAMGYNRFYNMTEATAIICRFSTSNVAAIENYGTFTDCTGRPYDY